MILGWKATSRPLGAGGHRWQSGTGSTAADRPSCSPPRSLGRGPTALPRLHGWIGHGNPFVVPGPPQPGSHLPPRAGTEPRVPCLQCQRSGVAPPIGATLRGPMQGSWVSSGSGEGNGPILPSQQPPKHRDKRPRVHGGEDGGRPQEHSLVPKKSKMPHRTFKATNVPKMLLRRLGLPPASDGTLLNILLLSTPSR